MERNFSRSAELKGVFTLGEKQVKAQEEIKAKKVEADGYKEKVVNLNKVLDGADGAPGRVIGLPLRNPETRFTALSVEPENPE